MARLDELRIEALTPRQRVSYDRIASGPREGVVGPLAAWLRVPAFADRAEALGRYCRFENGLPKRLNELAILMVAKHWRADFAWRGHAVLAREAGLADSIVEAIRIGRPPSFATREETVAHAFVDELLRDKAVGDATWSDAVAVLGEPAVIDLVGITGYYGLVAMTIKACAIGADVEGRLLP